MKGLLYTFIVFISLFVGSCKKSGQQTNDEISRAEKVMQSKPKKALTILEAIEPAELTQDSIKAKYYYARAYAHYLQDRFILSDSLIAFSTDYYKDTDLKRSILSATVLASYKFRIGERETAQKMLDSLLSLKNVPDSLLIEPLRSRIQLLAYNDDNESRIRHLLTIDKDSTNHPDYKFWLYFTLLFNGKNDSALAIINELIDLNGHNGDDENTLKFKYEKIGGLMEVGLYDQSIELTDSLININVDNSAVSYLHLWKTLGLLNKHQISDAVNELALSDSLSYLLPEDERQYYNSFATLLHSVLGYHKTGKVSFIPYSKINNPQRAFLQEEQLMRQEVTRQALEAENQRLALKAKNERQISLLVITILIALLLSGALIWYSLNKQRKSVELMERNETLQKLVDEYKSTPKDASANEKLRRAMLQQLGIIKMVAETPTEQNREMLRKLSSIESDTDGALVNWTNLFEIIDNLYSGFFTRLHNRFGNVLSDKEVQIIVLMTAGFSTKEISVITSQTMATIYTRKSTIRKKLCVPEKEDIVAFIRQEQDN